MSLRIRAASPANTPESGAVNLAEEGDGWAARLAKLIPAEALGLYGAGVALIPAGVASREVALWILAAASMLLAILIRLRATRDPQTGKPQVAAIFIAVVSFAIWLVALGPPNSPVQLPDGTGFYAGLAALIWGTFVPFFYNGD